MGYKKTERYEKKKAKGGSLRPMFTYNCLEKHLDKNNYEVSATKRHNKKMNHYTYRALGRRNIEKLSRLKRNIKNGFLIFLNKIR